MRNKVLFVHDGPLQKDSYGNYYGVTLGNSLKERFLYLGDSVTFMLRTKLINAEETARFSKIDNTNFSVIAIPDFKSITKYIKHSKEAHLLIEKAVLSNDIVVARLPSAIGSIAVEIAFKHKKPVLVEYVACTFDAYWNYSWKGKLIAHYKMLKQKALVKHVPYIIYVTKNFLQKRYPSFGEQTNCSNVEIEQVDPIDLEKRITKIQNSNYEVIIKLGTVAAINVPYKGHDDVFKAIALLKSKGIKVKYTLVGHGSPARLIALSKKLDIEDAIEIIGAIKHSEVFDFYRSLDLYIQPSKQEGLPRSVIEAMSTACPVLGSNVAGIPELIADNMLFEAGDHKQIAAKVSATNHSEMKKQAIQNFNNAMFYKKEVLMNRRLQFYKNFLEKNNLALPFALKEKLK